MKKEKAEDKFNKLIKEHSFTIIAVLFISMIFAPLILTFSHIPLLTWFNFSDTGEVGDTIGGITAPFINIIAAILVYKAFRAQIDANDNFQNQESYRIILDQIKEIKSNSDILRNTIEELNRTKGDYFNEDAKEALSQIELPPYKTALKVVTDLVFYTGELSIVYEQIEKYNGDKEYLTKKINYLYNSFFTNQLAVFYALIKIGEVKSKKEFGVYYIQFCYFMEIIKPDIENDLKTIFIDKTAK